MMLRLILLSTFVILFAKSCDAKTKSRPEYGKDFILFPSQDGSNRLVPAILTKGFIKQSATKTTSVPDEKDIHFFLYTTHNRDTPKELFVDDMDSLKTSNFIRNQELKIICHGFVGSFINPFPAHTKNKYLDSYGATPINVIVMDWSLLAAAPMYISAVGHVTMIGTKIGEMITFLIKTKYVTLDKIHIVGHSLGAHVAGIAGRYVSEKIGRKLARVTGLDPASPLINKPLRISKDVARFVDIIHTEGKFLGILSPLGTADFYPNGGFEQKGCEGEFFGGCSHNRAHEYFLESIIPLSSNNSRFGSCYCNGCKLREDEGYCYGEKFHSGECDCDPAEAMGEGVLQTARGLYFLETNSGFPFSQT